MTISRLLGALFNGPWPLTFGMMGVFGGLFVAASANLAYEAMACIGFLRATGWWGLTEGGALQLVELAALGYLSLALYVLFKGCLYGLLGRFQKH